jgi:hypothetical protein
VNIQDIYEILGPVDMAHAHELIVTSMVHSRECSQLLYLYGDASVLFPKALFVVY